MCEDTMIALACASAAGGTGLFYRDRCRYGEVLLPAMMVMLEQENYRKITAATSKYCQYFALLELMFPT
jgi:hypothetical protein